MATIGLLFGSFNPIHQGHLIIAEYFATHDCEKVELIVSPQNPLKKSIDLAPETHRLAMARLAIRGNQRVRVNAIEFSMPKPSYTYDTLVALRTRHPGDEFTLIIGSDNFDQFKSWRNWEKILEEFNILAYRRPGFSGSALEKHRHVRMIENVPMIHLSATYIRDSIRKGRSVRYLVPEAARKYIAMHGLYI